MNRLIAALLKAHGYKHQTTDIKLVETHISYIFLTGTYAYKVKKIIEFSFLDYSTLEKRKSFCEKELQLNKQLAPDLYIDVVPITKDSESNYVISGDGKIVEYAVRMHQFDENNLLSELITKEQISNKIIDDTASQIANFHLNSQIANKNSKYGSPTTILHPVQENFTQARELVGSNQDLLNKISKLEDKISSLHTSLTDIFVSRKSAGLIKACHGDLHLSNIVLHKGNPIIYDCIEFNESFRWLDPMADLAYLIMDLIGHNKSNLSARLLNNYLEITGDYGGIKVLDYYISYRAMVKAKVQLFTDKSDIPGFSKYLDIAEQCLNKVDNSLYITMGVSGAGKSTVALSIVEKKSAIRIRSDVERKRLFKEENDAELLYNKSHSIATYNHLSDLANLVLSAGYNVIIDAAFLLQEQRNIFVNFARQHKKNFTIIECIADKETLINRIKSRASKQNDPSDATVEVLEKQLAKIEYLSPLDRYHCITIDISKCKELHDIPNKLNKLLNFRHKACEI